MTAIVQQAAGSATYLQACRTLGVTQAQATGLVSREATSAAEALVIGSDNLDTPLYAALCSAFVKQILGENEYSRAERDFRQASEELGET